MKTFVVKLFLTLILLTPNLCFADFICSHHELFSESLKIQNLTEFPDYNFYFTTGLYDYERSLSHSDSTLALADKSFSFKSPGDVAVGIFAQNKKTSKLTSTIEVFGEVEKTTLITIQKIENDSIYFKTEVVQTQSAGFNSKPVSPVAKLLLLISFCGLLFYTTTLIFRKQKT